MIADQYRCDQYTSDCNANQDQEKPKVRSYLSGKLLLVKFLVKLLSEPCLQLRNLCPLQQPLLQVHKLAQGCGKGRGILRYRGWGSDARQCCSIAVHRCRGLRQGGRCVAQPCTALLHPSPHLTVRKVLLGMCTLP